MQKVRMIQFTTSLPFDYLLKRLYKSGFPLTIWHC
ncbi:hypothetical protein L1278_002771 [Pontibacter sp. HSC-36F09]|nr:hypothetical protein [Pontibacter sp. HSC-36F09]